MNKNIKMIVLFTVVGSTLLIGHATYSKIQRDKRQRMNQVVQEAKQSLRIAETNPHHMNQIDSGL